MSGTVVGAGRLAAIAGHGESGGEQVQKVTQSLALDRVQEFETCLVITVIAVIETIVDGREDGVAGSWGILRKDS